MKKNKAVYAGTFDPITYGHIDLVARASKLFDEVIVAIGVNQTKNPLFNIEERVQLCTRALQDYPDVKVHPFDSLLLDFAKKHDANIILRGLRTVTDFDYELQLASMNRAMNGAVESLFLMPDEKYMFVSSTLVREIAALNGDVTPFVPPIIAEAIHLKNKK